MTNSCVRSSGDEIKILLEKIDKMQKESVRGEIEEEMCDGFLGNNDLCRFKCNTRPLQVYTDDDVPWGCPVNRDMDGCDGEAEKSCILRAEKVTDDSVTFRALKDCGFDGEHRKYESTDSYITIKLGCICALRCMKDTFVDLCIR